MAASGVFATAPVADATVSWRNGLPGFRVGRNRLDLSVTNNLSAAHWYKVHAWIHGDGVRSVSAGWHHVEGSGAADLAERTQHPAAVRAREFMESDWRWLPDKVWGELPDDESYWRARDAIGDMLEAFSAP